MTNFVEVPNPNLGDWAPCPYAKQARINDKISIKFSDNLKSAVFDSLPELEHKEVVVICFDHMAISMEQTEQLVEELNNELMPNDYVILEDHPDSVEIINNVQMNFGHCGLLIIQRLSKLNIASDQLNTKGYYQFWNQDNIDYVVSWRNQ